MKYIIHFMLCISAMQNAYAIEPFNSTWNLPISLCESTDIGNFQYDLILKGNQQIGIISGNGDTLMQRQCAEHINVIGQYGLQADGSYLVTLSTLVGDTGNCDAWSYQFIWSVDQGTGEVNFFNNEVEQTQLTLGACS